MTVHRGVPVETTVKGWMQSLGTLNFTGVIDDVFGLVWKLAGDALHCQRGEMRRLFLSKRVHLRVRGND